MSQAGTTPEGVFGDKPGFDDPQHHSWLAGHRSWLLDFYQPHVAVESGGYAWLDDDGQPLPKYGHPLFLGARMIHVFALAEMEGRDGAAQLVEHGLDFYTSGEGHDDHHGGWFATVGGQTPSQAKELYGQAHMLLAASTAMQAGHSRAQGLLDEALSIIERHYWREDEGRCVEAYDRSFTILDDYRGQNANMHLTEALLAAHEATGESLLLERAARVAQFIAGRAADSQPGAWRLPEHFDAQWRPLPGYNADEPRHQFRPYGSQPGHWLEWAKLLMQLHGLGVQEPWVLPAAENLFHGAFVDAWAGNGGFVYTVDWDGAPVVTEKFFWEVPEGIGAARLLHLATGDPRYQARYVQQWDHAVAHMVDWERGSWHTELDQDNRPVSLAWEGKADVYHVYQATLAAGQPAHQGLAAWLASRGSVG